MPSRVEAHALGRWKLVPFKADHAVLEHQIGRTSFDVISGVRAHVDASSASFSIETYEECSAETIEHCIYDLILPCLLAFDGQLVLHGGLSFTGDSAVGFIGESGQGKSTLVAGLHGLGWPLMGDDAFTLELCDDACSARSVYASLRLFPDSVVSLFPAGHETAPMAHYSEKRRVSFSAGPRSAPLRAIIRLGDEEPNIHIQELSLAEACMALVSNSFILDPEDTAQNKAKFQLASEAAKTIPVYDLHYPRRYDRMHNVRDAIADKLGVSSIQ